MLIRQKVDNWLKSFSGIFGKVETPIIDKQEVEIAKAPTTTANISWYRSLWTNADFSLANSRVGLDRQSTYLGPTHF